MTARVGRRRLGGGLTAQVDLFMLSGMTVDAIDVETFSTEEKLRLMERLWESLARNPRLDTLPWHERLLAARDDEWARRHEVGEDWATVKEELRAEFRR
ncbi:MAG: addiction module protein [Opitutales bacterium]